MSARDYALLEQAHYIKAVDQLVFDLKSVGETPESITAWLGHPLEEITPSEMQTLRGYWGDAQKALQQRKKTPYLPPNVVLH